MPYTIMPASSAYSHEIARLIERSFTKLCAQDHGEEPDRIAAWLQDKSADNVETWIDGPGRTFVAQDQDKQVLGFGMANPDGRILLNYVLPEARFSGISKALMRAIEDYFLDRGLDEIHLESTATAANLFRSLGYEETGESLEKPDMVFRSFKKAI